MEKKIFFNINIVPYKYLLDNDKGLSSHDGGPVYPNWNEHTDIRHCRQGKAIDTYLSYEIKNLNYMKGCYCWCGPICSHYGHQVAAFSSRILMYKNKIKENFFYCFSIKENSNINSIEDTPEFFRNILEFFNIPLDRVIIIKEATEVEKLIVYPQSEQLGDIKPSQEYLQFLIMNTKIKFSSSKKGTYFISRAGMKARLAGEGYLEYIFGLNNIKVIRPENISLNEQLRIFSSANKLIFSEGSALHTLQLLGKVEDTLILVRRPGYKLASGLLSERCRTLKYIDYGTLVYGKSLNGDDALDIGITIPNKDNILEILKSLNFKIYDFDFNIFFKFVQHDLDVWVRRELSSPRGSIKESIQQIKEKIQNSNFKFNLPNSID